MSTMPTRSSFRPEQVIATIASHRRGSMRRLPAYTLAAVLVVLVATTGALFTPGEWYAGLNKPSFTPPDAVFAPVWGLMYTLNIIALALLLNAPRGAPRRAALQAMSLQLALNALWSPVFFGAQSVEGGVLVILAMLAVIAVTIARSLRVRPLAAILLVPYLGWVAWASVLNLAIWRLNP